MAERTQRNIGLDVIRSLAVFSVIAIHFFLATDFYKVTVTGPSMFFMVFLRSAFTVCVPLFLMLSGYLIHTKSIGKAYYRRIIRILFVYVAASLLCGICKKYILRMDISVPGLLINIFTFETAPYSWYVEMYIGLFLLIPFLNVLYDGLQKKGKQALLLTFFALTALPAMLNIFRLAGLDWWLQPSSNTHFFPLIPDWWVSIYPITYFYLGRYLQEYPLNWKPIKKLLLLLGVLIFNGAFNFYRSYGTAFYSGPWQDWGSGPVLIQTVLVFSLLADLRYEKMPNWLKCMFSHISQLSFGAYLLSWIFDQLVYYPLNKHYASVHQKIVWFPVVVILVFSGSLLLSKLVDIAYTCTVKRFLDKKAQAETSRRS